MTEETTKTLTENQQLRRNQVLDAAEGEFVKKGFHSAGMAGIAKSASMSIGHVYHYFPNKNAIIEAIVEREQERHVCGMDEMLQMPVEGFVEALAQRVRDQVLEKSDLFRSVLMFEILAESQRNPRIAQLLREYDEQMRKAFCQIIRDKLNLSDPDKRTEAIFTVLSGLPTRMIRNPDALGGPMQDMVHGAIVAILTED